MLTRPDERTALYSAAISVDFSRCIWYNYIGAVSVTDIVPFNGIIKGFLVYILIDERRK